MNNKVKIIILCSFISNLGFTADLENGKDMFNDECTSCHKDSSSFIRPDKERKVHDLKKLEKQVHRCVAMTGASLFEEDEVDVVDYLNQTYYQFKKQEVE